MKKLSSSLTIFWFYLLLFWTTYWADCSYYQQLITYYEWLISEYESQAAWYSASMGSQMSAHGLSSSAIASATSYNPYSSQINELKWKLIQAKSDYNSCQYSLSSSSSSNYNLNAINNSLTSNEYFQKAMPYLEAASSASAKNDFESAITNQIKAVEYLKKACEYSNTWEDALTDAYWRLWWYYCFNGDYNFWKDFLKKSLSRKEDDHYRKLYNSCINWQSLNNLNNTSTSSNSCSQYWSHAYLVGGECDCEAWYMRNSNKTSCIKYDANQSCANQFGQYAIATPDAPGYCTCKDWYTWNNNETACIKIDYNQSCVNAYGQYSKADPDDPENYCVCKDWYKWNSGKTSCIKIEVNNSTTSNSTTSNTNNSYSYSDNYWYLKDYNKAYQFAYTNKITTMPTMEEANMNWEIIRAEIAKMLANWVKSLGKTPDTSKSCNFKDISWVKGDLYPAIIESCQLGIMWQWIDEFRPFDKITKWEVATAVSRIIWGSKYDWWQPFYWKHMESLHKLQILDNLQQPEKNELRWNVMVMLMRASGTDELADCEDPAVLLACSLGEPSCPDKCDEETKVEEETDIDALVNDILKESEEFDNYIASIDKKIQEVNDKYNNGFDKDASTEKVLEILKDKVKTDESVKTELWKIWAWKWDSSLIDFSIEYVGLHITMFTKYLNLQELIIETQKLKESWQEDKANENAEKMNSLLKETEPYQETIKTKNEEYKKLYADFKKKYGSN